MSKMKQLLANLSTHTELKEAISKVCNPGQFEQVAKSFGYDLTANEIEQFLSTLPNVVNQDSVVYGRDWCYPGSGLDKI